MTEGEKPPLLRQYATGEITRLAAEGAGGDRGDGSIAWQRCDG
jgi:hypothetical protein